MSHTPGPWKISHGGLAHDDGFSIATDNAAAKLVKIVCECWPCTVVSSDHRWELASNARLIAAAPDLLEALEGVLCLARLKWGNLDADANTVFESAELAIKKAKGGAE